MIFENKKLVKFENSLVLVISIKLFLLSLFFLLIKFDEIKKRHEKMIKKDISAVKVRLDSGRDLNFVKSMQEKYSKFMPTEGLAYESKLAIMLNKSLK